MPAHKTVEKPLPMEGLKTLRGLKIFSGNANRPLAELLVVVRHPAGDPSDREQRGVAREPGDEHHRSEGEVDVRGDADATPRLMQHVVNNHHPIVGVRQAAHGVE